MFFTLFATAKPFLIPRDKQLHLGAGFLITTSTSIISKQLHLNRPVIIGLSVGLFSGVAKELYDLTGRGTPSLADAIYTGVGSISGGIVCTISFNLHKRKKSSRGN